MEFRTRSTKSVVASWLRSETFSSRPYSTNALIRSGALRKHRGTATSARMRWTTLMPLIRKSSPASLSDEPNETEALFELREQFQQGQQSFNTALANFIR